MQQPGGADGNSRRGFVSWIAMFAGLLAGYGAGAMHFFQYLVPLNRDRRRRELFIGMLGDFSLGATRTVRDPRGDEIIISRVADNPADRARDFRALSTKCPHLGCKIYWESGKQRFRCPCHEGIFDPHGKALSGPPAQEGKNMNEYDLRINADTGAVYVLIAQESAYGA